MLKLRIYIYSSYTVCVLHFNVFVCCLNGDLLCARAFGNGAINSYRVLLIDVNNSVGRFQVSKTDAV